MISKRDAKEFVLKLTISSLRRMAKRITTGDIGGNATQKDVAKVKKEMEDLAAKLEKRLPSGDVIDAVPTHLKEGE